MLWSSSFEELNSSLLLDIPTAALLHCLSVISIALFVIFFCLFVVLPSFLKELTVRHWPLHEFVNWARTNRHNLKTFNSNHMVTICYL